jgi:hypothetical protein
MINMGLESLGGPGIIHKRKFRWTFRIDGPCNLKVSEKFVKLAARPNLSIEETEINYLNGKTWIPGKGTWETITVTYYDVASNENIDLWSWIATIYEFTNPITLKQSTTRASYAGTGVLTMYDGCGDPVETWRMGDMWPQAINWQDLDYSNSEECTVEVTLRYGTVKYEGNPFCGGIPQAYCGGCAAGCAPGTSPPTSS